MNDKPTSAAGELVETEEEREELEPRDRNARRVVGGLLMLLGSGLILLNVLAHARPATIFVGGGILVLLFGAALVAGYEPTLKVLGQEASGRLPRRRLRKKVRGDIQGLPKQGKRPSRGRRPGGGGGTSS